MDKEYLNSISEKIIEVLYNVNVRTVDNERLKNDGTILRKKYFEEQLTTNY